MKIRFYSPHYFGARETDGNPVMQPDVTIELVKRIAARKETEKRKQEKNYDIIGGYMYHKHTSVPPLG